MGFEEISSYFYSITNVVYEGGRDDRTRISYS